jgi:nucleotidyltransferase/DNA polymerase involved in DNA repair
MCGLTILEFEQVRLGLADDLPLICAQWQSIIAVNYPARKFGIKRYVPALDHVKWVEAYDVASQQVQHY